MGSLYCRVSAILSLNPWEKCCRDHVNRVPNGASNREPSNTAVGKPCGCSHNGHSHPSVSFSSSLENLERRNLVILRPTPSRRISLNHLFHPSVPLNLDRRNIVRPRSQTTRRYRIIRQAPGTEDFQDISKWVQLPS